MWDAIAAPILILSGDASVNWSKVVLPATNVILSEANCILVSIFALCTISSATNILPPTVKSSVISASSLD